MNSERKTSILVLRIVICILIICVIFIGIYKWKNMNVRPQDTSIGFVGTGTVDNPYLINTADDLLKLYSAVADGNTFQNAYFKQTSNIDLSEVDNWMPIGEKGSGYYFEGTYDGAGHYLTNLNINGFELGSSQVGLFGQLSGTVCNLGIESGLIIGDYIGSIASHAGSPDALIINCYNKATLISTDRCGGIADNFGTGKIVCCANYGELEGKQIGQIASFNAGVIYGCFGNGNLIFSDIFTGEVIQSFETANEPSEMNDILYEAEGIYTSGEFKLIKW